MASSFADDFRTYVLPDSVGVWETLGYRLQNWAIDFVVTGAFWTIAAAGIIVTDLWEIPLEDGVFWFSFFVFATTTLLFITFIVRPLLRAGYFIVYELTPPYETATIEFNRPDTDEMGYMRWPSKTYKSLTSGLVYYLILLIWISFQGAWASIDPDPLETIRFALRVFPGWARETIVQSISNYTGIELRPVLEGIGDPAVVVFVLLSFGAMFVFGGIATWNLIYGIRLHLKEGV